MQEKKYHLVASQNLSYNDYELLQIIMSKSIPVCVDITNDVIKLALFIGITQILDVSKTAIFLSVLFHSYPPTLPAVENIWQFFVSFPSCLRLAISSTFSLFLSFFLLFLLPFSLLTDIHLITNNSHKYECGTRFLLVRCNGIYIANYYYYDYDYCFSNIVSKPHNATMQAYNKEHLAK